MSKAPIQAVADRISAVFVPVILTVAFATWLGWFVAGAMLTSPYYLPLLLDNHNVAPKAAHLRTV